MYCLILERDINANFFLKLYNKKNMYIYCLYTFYLHSTCHSCQPFQVSNLLIFASFFSCIDILTILDTVFSKKNLGYPLPTKAKILLLGRARCSGLAQRGFVICKLLHRFTRCAPKNSGYSFSCYRKKKLGVRKGIPGKENLDNQSIKLLRFFVIFVYCSYEKFDIFLAVCSSKV